MVPTGDTYNLLHNKGYELTCPHCKSLALTRLHRSQWERLRSLFAERRKWECATCGWRWLARIGEAPVKED